METRIERIEKDVETIGSFTSTPGSGFSPIHLYGRV